MVTTGFLLVIRTLFIAFTDNFTIFLVLRTVQGLFVAGIAAGFLGRVLSGVLAGTFNWRITFFVVGILNLLGSCIMFHFLPDSRHFKRSAGLLNAYVAKTGWLSIHERNDEREEDNKIHYCSDLSIAP